MPSCSIGFWVAITRKGGARGWVWPSTVTWRSAIDSSSADCVLGKTVDLVGQDHVGEHRSRPELRPARAPVEDAHADHVRRQQVGGELHAAELAVDGAASALRQAGLATPGTSSSSRCPSDTRHSTTSSMTSSLPWMTWATLLVILSKSSGKVRVCWRRDGAVSWAHLRLDPPSWCGPQRRRACREYAAWRDIR